MKLQVVKDKTSKTVNLVIKDSSSTTGAGLTGLAFNTSGLSAYYVRERAAEVAITLATQTVTGAYASGGFVEISAANMPGWYRLDIPDAALATGSESVGIMLKGAANMAPSELEIELIGVDLQAAALAANMLQIDGEDVKNVLYTTDISMPDSVGIPVSGSNKNSGWIVLAGANGQPIDPDGADDPTRIGNLNLQATNENGVDRTANISGTTRLAQGLYAFDYLVASTHAKEQIAVSISALVGSINYPGATLFRVGLDADINETVRPDSPAQRTLGEQMGAVVSGTVSTATVTPTTTTFAATRPTGAWNANADHYKGRTLIFTNGARNEEGTVITASTTSGAEVTLTVEALTAAPTNGEQFIIV